MALWKLHDSKSKQMSLYALGKDIIRNLLQFSGEGLKASALETVSGLEIDHK